MNGATRTKGTIVSSRKVATSLRACGRLRVEEERAGEGERHHRVARGVARLQLGDPGQAALAGPARVGEAMGPPGGIPAGAGGHPSGSRGGPSDAAARRPASRRRRPRAAAAGSRPGRPPSGTSARRRVGRVRHARPSGTPAPAGAGRSCPPVSSSRGSTSSSCPVRGSCGAGHPLRCRAERQPASARGRHPGGAQAASHRRIRSRRERRAGRDRSRRGREPPRRRLVGAARRCAARLPRCRSRPSSWSVLRAGHPAHLVTLVATGVVGARAPRPGARAAAARTPSRRPWYAGAGRCVLGRTLAAVATVAVVGLARLARAVRGHPAARRRHVRHRRGARHRRAATTITLAPAEWLRRQGDCLPAGRPGRPPGLRADAHRR